MSFKSSNSKNCHSDIMFIAKYSLAKSLWNYPLLLRFALLSSFTFSLSFEQLLLFNPLLFSLQINHDNNKKTTTRNSGYRWDPTKNPHYSHFKKCEKFRKRHIIFSFFILIFHDRIVFLIYSC